MNGKQRSNLGIGAAQRPKTRGDQNSPSTEFNATEGAQKATKCVVNAHKIGLNSRRVFAISVTTETSYPNFPRRILSLFRDFVMRSFFVVADIGCACPASLACRPGELASTALLANRMRHQ